MKTQNRNYLIDNSKGLLIFLVVLGHSLEFIRKDYEVARLLYVFIYEFHMPVFVFISGYLSKNVEKGRRNAVRNFLTPFLLFNIIWNLITLVGPLFLRGKFTELPSEQAFSFFTPGWALWYIFAMFLWKILLPDLLKFKNIFILSVIAGIFVKLSGEFGSYMALSRTITFAPFFLAGYYSSEEKLKRFRKFTRFNILNKVPSILILIIGVLIALIFVNYSNIADEFFWADRSYSNFNIEIFTGILLYIAVYIIGFAFVYVFINLMPENQTFLSKIGKNTLSVYFLHTYFIGSILGLTSLMSSNLGKLLALIVGSLIVTFILSRDGVARFFNKFLDKFNRLLFIKE
ncbi:acyltransferase family protein [Clostridium perfringens]|uniref:Acyltransferase family protein n=7 Tax=Clostridium perfringens TaxID=1502 RepID=A0AAP6WKA1_CLOPF|nr:acyltransferase family protein [Clostridium perfringens]EDT24572.1 acyltransferase family protein [Clostridium perfringens B str. ATCC 3626]EHK2278149.1 acyltransferase family protein [Clostridium perfringens]EIF6153853.1 acyltransferase family protein [Clostridium perfringens]ELC8353564.1 acyltransferase family protein [Clostridium perfringens]ELC8374496.1 acyltransferase family protein [Clostridium perfringens]